MAQHCLYNRETDSERPSLREKRDLHAKGKPPVRRRLPPEQRKSEILDAALDEFLAHGYAKTKIEDIALRAGAAKGLVLFHFKNKANIVHSIVSREVERRKPGAVRLNENSQASLREQLETLMQFIFRDTEENPSSGAVFQLMSIEGPNFPDLMTKYFQSAILPYVQQVERLLETVTPKGTAQSQQLTEAAVALLSGVFVSAQWNLLFQRILPLDLDELFRMHLKIMLAGLLPPQ